MVIFFLSQIKKINLTLLQAQLSHNLYLQKQQILFISTKAANSIYKNIREKFNSEYLNEKHFCDKTVKEIKKLGITSNKARTIKEVSELFLTENIVDLSKLSEQKLNDKLLSIFGIGPWSISMFEIFCLGRQDVFSSKDAGLRLAMNKSGMVAVESNWKLYDEFAKKWSPYRTTASLHLWKNVDQILIFKEN